MIPYSNRVWKQGTFHFIQPFADAQGDLSKVDLYLDNNAFIDLLRSDNLLDGLKNVPGAQEFTLNPTIALAEQWISNPVFREQAKAGPGKHEMIERFMVTAAVRGQIFAPNYIDEMIGMCQNREPDLRVMAGALFAYIAALRSLQRRKMPFEDRIARFRTLLAGDVPVFSGLIGLAAFTLYALANRGAVDQSGAQLVTSVDSFFAPKEDEPEALSQGYLRNRAMDLLTWYMMPRFLNAEVNKNAPTPLVVTADKFLAAVPFRFLPPLRVQGHTPAITLAVTPDGLDEKDQNGFLGTFKRLQPPPRQGGFPIERRLLMLENLNNAVSTILSSEDRAGFEVGLQWAAGPKP